MEKRWTSLCKVNRPDKNDDIWMVRIADLVEGTLIEPSFDDKNFGNGQNAKMNSENGELKQHICNIHRRLRLLFSITISEYETYSMQ